MATAPSPSLLDRPTRVSSRTSRPGQPGRGILSSKSPAQTPGSRPAGKGTLAGFLLVETLNSRQHVEALRPFRSDEFGTGASSPSEAHIQAANRLLYQLQQRLKVLVSGVGQAASLAMRNPQPAQLQSLLAAKDVAGSWVKYTEKVWDFYFELFGQRQSSLSRWLLAADRIALDCYQAVYTGLGEARSIPSPPPFSYMATGFTPATFRRNIRLTRLGKNANPFPIIQLPYHRLVNPWTLGAIHHEVSHNIQSDLGLWNEVPRRILARFAAAGLPAGVGAIWARWHKETWADLCGLLLGGPSVVASLIGVLARNPRSVQSFNTKAVHPTPYLRAYISIELLRRMGFSSKAESFRRLWDQLYPSDRLGNIPREFMETFDQANRLVVDTLCYQPYPQLGGKRLAEVVSFKPHYQDMVIEAGRRLANGIDPGIIPERFLVGAAGWAMENRQASPAQISRNFYRALGDR